MEVHEMVYGLDVEKLAEEAWYTLHVRSRSEAQPLVKEKEMKQ
jgi:hypothetical protein